MKLVVFCLRFTSCLALLSSGLAFSQTAFNESEKDAVAAAPVAYVYVSQSPVSPGPNQVRGFAAAANGALTPIEGSPFQADVNFMAVNGKYLFGSTTDDLYLNTYTIEPDGALKFAVANDISKMTGGYDTIGQTLALSLDHTGATLYAFRFPDYEDNDEYESYTIDKATGALTLTPGYIPNGGNSDNGDGAFTISSNDKYFYGVASGDYGYDVWMMDRESNGTLVQPPSGSPVITLPEPKNGFRFDPIGIATDPSDH